MARQPTTFRSAFGSYWVQETLGEGGSGRVFKVVDEENESFAIKCLDPDKATAEKLKRFKNELMFCLNNQHPNVVRVLDYGTVSIKKVDCPFYVMPYYSSTLRDLMQESIGYNRVLPLFSQVLDGVEAAHLQSVWHRDLKPENVLYDSETDTLVVADFGIAHFAEEQLHTLVKTNPRARLANFQYAAPEQRQKGQLVDQRADIYALGLILNEMFTGSLAQGSGYRTIESVASDHAYLDDLVDVMIRQLPAERPESVADVKRKLIARRKQFVSQQKLSKLKNQVIPRHEVDDPLVDSPVSLVSVDYDRGELVLTLSQPVKHEWSDTFRSIRYRKAVAGGEPGRFRFEADRARIRLLNESQAQELVNHFKEYLEQANADYRKRLEREQRRRERAERERLEEQTREEEKRQRILGSIEM
jgi:serine/threonine protein kinase